jgi:hypothetical protein
VHNENRIKLAFKLDLGSDFVKKKIKTQAKLENYLKKTQ